MSSGASGRVAREGVSAREEQAEVAKDNFRAKMSAAKDRSQVVCDAAIKVHDVIWAARQVVETSSMTVAPGDHEPVMRVADMILDLVKEVGQANSIQGTLASTFSALKSMNEDDADAWKDRQLDVGPDDEEDVDGEDGDGVHRDHSP